QEDAGCQAMQGARTNAGRGDLPGAVAQDPGRLPGVADRLRGSEEQEACRGEIVTVLSNRRGIRDGVGVTPVHELPRAPEGGAVERDVPERIGRGRLRLSKPVHTVRDRVVD